jgi:hypothetical protein
LIFTLFGAEMPRGKERKVILARLGQDLAHIEKRLGYRLIPILRLSDLRLPNRGARWT